MKLRDLFENNRQWAEAARKKNPDFFATLCGQQSPTYLWIGCSDSRVPANTIVGLDPGELFVHRNVGNVVDHLCELNVMAQVRSVCETTVIRDAWRRGGELFAHGWIYRLTDGLLRDLDVSVGSQNQLVNFPRGDAQKQTSVSPVLKPRETL